MGGIKEDIRSKEQAKVSWTGSEEKKERKSDDGEESTDRRYGKRVPGEGVLDGGGEGGSRH